MAHFIISYDLHNRRDYEPVYELLRTWGAVRLLQSVWCLSSNASAATIRDGLLQRMDYDDAVAVIEVKEGCNWATMRTQDGGTFWLKRVSP